MPAFDEDVFIKALTDRPEDARNFISMFRPAWLEEADLQPVLQEIYAFTKKHRIPPSIETLRKIFLIKDSELYNLRFSKVFDRLENSDPDPSMIIFTMDQARGVAITRAFEAFIRDPSTDSKMESYDGTGLLREIATWYRTFADSETDRHYKLDESIAELLEKGADPMVKVPTGLNCIDMFTGGGLRGKQAGIIIAPTGHGKSALLVNIAHKMATVQEQNVWFITNELPIEELTERFLTKMTGITLDRIMEEPREVYGASFKHYKKYFNRMHFTEYTREVSMDQIEADFAKLRNTLGFKPQVVVIDYMERMKPSLTGHSRAQEWQWYGAVARDIVRFAKREGVIVWTAAQTNRDAVRKDEKGKQQDISIAHAQASIRHLQEVTAVIGARQTEVPGTGEELLEIQSLKQRQSKNRLRSVYVKCDLAKMLISNEEVDFQAMKNNLLSNNQTNPLTGSPQTPRQKQVAAQVVAQKGKKTP